ncbi:MAG: ribosome maturation factor RimM [Cytophagaceae bacterium]|nr:ribosome maturation factor RimM [Cytophagaceae bacterium]
MTKEECYELGKIVKTHGLRGELSIYLDVDDPSEYEDLDSFLVERDGGLIPYFFETFQLQGNRALVKLEEINDIVTASELVGCPLYLTLANLPKLTNQQFYYHEVVGYQVVDEQRGLLGLVASVATLPHQDLLVVDHQNREVLIPINDDIVLSIDRDAQTLQVRLPDGLLEVYLSE